MGNLIRPTKVRVTTREGECQLNITIDLNINLNTGTVDVQSTKTTKVIEEKEEDKTIWAIPTFESKDKVKFGKKKEE